MVDDWTPESDKPKAEKLAEKLLEQIEKHEEREAAFRAAHAPAGTVGGEVASYTPPTYEEVQERIRKAWGGVKELVSDAPDQVKSMVFQWLVDAQSPHYGRM
jgi:predicted trehalose synthase